MESNQSETDMENSNFHSLSTGWCLWAHLPHDTDWSIQSYKKIHTFDTLEDGIALCNITPEKMVKNCMLFLMKDGILPTWEDKANKDGGCFSYKVPNKNVYDNWVKMFYMVIGNSISDNTDFVNIVNGITISPKKSFCILKVWTSDCTIQNANNIKTDLVKGLTNQGCLFKKHLPQY